MNKQRMALDIFLAFHRGADHFTAQLLRLISKADHSNRLKLEVAFPIAVEIYNEWAKTQDEQEFFNKYDIGHMLRDGTDKDIYMRLFGRPLQEAIHVVAQEKAKCTDIE